ncbi:MAG: hypothetical protein WC797_03525 [Candidatus Paceibacterota bacterium]|jgi:hypothetical protein
MKSGEGFLGAILLIALVVLVTFGFVNVINRGEHPTNTVNKPVAYVPFSGPTATGEQLSKSDVTVEGKPVSLIKPKEAVIKLSGSYNAQSSVADREYITIQAPSTNGSPIDITGWELSSKTASAKIPRVYETYRLAGNNYLKDVVLNPGDEAIIVSGKSPLDNNSFRVNKCSGYLEQNKDFYPSLPIECPRAINEVDPDIVDDACIDFVDSISQCQMPTTIPARLGNTCSFVINKNLGYESCVEKHRNDKDFQKGSFRVYLKNESEIWKQKREEIQLFNAKGILVDTLSY